MEKTVIGLVHSYGVGFFVEFFWFFSVVEIDIFLHSTFVFMLLRHTIKIAVQKSILYLNVRQLRFQLFLSKRAPTESLGAHIVL